MAALVPKLFILPPSILYFFYLSGTVRQRIRYGLARSSHTRGQSKFTASGPLYFGAAAESTGRVCLDRETGNPQRGMRKRKWYIDAKCHKMSLALSIVPSIQGGSSVHCACIHRGFGLKFSGPAWSASVFRFRAVSWLWAALTFRLLLLLS